jgi:hypothetical protein
LIELGLEEHVLNHIHPLGSHIYMKQSNGSILFQSNFDDSNNNQSTWLSINESTTENVSIKNELFRNGKTVINRGALRELMLQEVMENYGDQCTIRWNSKIVDFKVYHPKDGSRCSKNLPVEVFLGDGNKIQGDILLGCDGIFSKVRELLPNCIRGVYPSNPKLRYLDVAWVRGVCSKRHIELNNESSLFRNKDAYIGAIADPCGNIFMMESHESSDDICWYFGFPFSNDCDSDTTRIDDRNKIANMVLTRVNNESWHDDCHVQTIVKATLASGGPLLFRNLYDRTVEDVAAWKVPEPWVPVTLLGDAFHPVTSYAMAGGGSNAMADGVAVTKEILCAALVQISNSWILIRMHYLPKHFDNTKARSARDQFHKRRVQTSTQ